jgi:hypothetical protein
MGNTVEGAHSEKEIAFIDSLSLWGPEEEAWRTWPSASHVHLDFQVAMLTGDTDVINHLEVS